MAGEHSSDTLWAARRDFYMTAMAVASPGMVRRSQAMGTPARRIRSGAPVRTETRMKINNLCLIAD